MPPTQDSFDGTPLPHEDLQLVRAALKGENSALNLVADRTSIVPQVVARLNQRWGRPLTVQDVEDLSQDIVLDVIRKLEGYHGLSPFEAWLFRFCSLQLRNRVRREISRRKVVTNIGDEPLDGVAPVENTSAQIDGQYMWDFVDRLDEIERKIIRAKHSDGLSFTEVGARLGLPTSSVKTHYYRSLDQIRMWVRQHANTEETS